MSFEDQLHIATPEGVDLELTLAGVGSRMLGGILDQLIKLVGGGLLVLLFLALAPLLSGVWTAIVVGVLIAIAFAFQFFYDVLFEVLGGGKTIGKRAAGTRVIRANGSPVDFRSSAIRNLVRLVDSQIGNLVGILIILFSPRNQRLGDIAAGTVVIRDRKAAVPVFAVRYSSPDEPLHPWDVSAVDRDSLATLHSFLARRELLAPMVRSRLARELYDRVRPLVGGVAEDLGPEAFIEEVVRIKSSQ